METSLYLTSYLGQYKLSKVGMQKTWTYELIVCFFLGLSSLLNLGFAQADTAFSKINSVFDEQFPTLSLDGRNLYFIRRNHPNNIGLQDLPDIWVSARKENGLWRRPIHLGVPLNDIGVDRLAGLSIDEKTLYTVKTDGYQSWINISRRQGRRWSDLQPMIIDRFIPGASATFSVSKDEKYLIIASKQPGGQGQADLYVAFREDEKTWGRPLNLGASLNTGGRESWAMIAPDGQTLYFASDGRADGLGGLDLWMSRRQDGSWLNWSTPLNLGTEINTPADETCLAISGKGTSVIINRAQDKKQYDLKERKLPVEAQAFPIVILHGRALASDQKPQLSSLIYRPLDDSDAVQHSLSLEKNGFYQLIIPLNRPMGIFGEAADFLPLSERYEATPRPLDTPKPYLAALVESNESYRRREAQVQELQADLQLTLDKVRERARERKKYLKQLTAQTYADLEALNLMSANPEMEILQSRYNIYRRSYQDTLQELTEKVNGRRIQLSNQAAGAGGEKAKKDFIPGFPDQEAAKIQKQLRQQQRLEQTSDSLSEYWTFQMLKREVEKELIYDMLPGVQDELFQELFPIVENAMQKEFDIDTLSRISQEKEKIQIRLLKDLEQLAPAISNLSIDSIQHKNWALQIKTDLKTLLKPHLRLALKRSLQSQFLGALQIEFYYQAQKLAEMDKRKVLEQKLAGQEKLESSSKEAAIFLDQEMSLINSGLPSQKQEKYQKIEKNFSLLPLKKGQILSLKNTAFLPDTITLRPGSDKELARILNFLQANKDLHIEVRSHTHGWYDHAAAMRLTTDRARLIANFFIENGVAAERLEYTGFGKTMPLEDNKTREGRSDNQRIEIKVL